ncbi:MAG: LamG domain-containing protein, partial [Bacteroidota bacterium]|nr:LamG domain-containing protein [Bacteroidota bacterium]
MRRIYNWLIPIALVILGMPVMHAQEQVAYYDFNGSAKDKTTYQNHASVHGATLTQDRFGVANHAFLFDGEMSSITAPNAVQLESPAVTVSFWVRVDELPDQGEVYLLSHGGWQERWKISLPSHGKPVWTTNHENGISDMDSGDANFLQVGVWTHVVMVHDGAKDIIYFDGGLVAEKAVVGNLNNTSFPLGIGYNPIERNLFFKGALDEVAIYNGALSATE